MAKNTRAWKGSPAELAVVSWDTYIFWRHSRNQKHWSQPLENSKTKC